ncbi:hypothetical protein [Dyadobacter sp. CY323]|uniref:hypothetical protein n=1 Tax=Dyadobacter sp. CY323 TaxID=2907302 RepID=UPI001F3D8FDA|nr:hypothetical protein [Dyadobacter sp. CY323]MCE6988994.1 hypothetical protein [Dyadobacter sp. CY323]
MKKFLFTVVFGIVVLVLLTTSWKADGTCDQIEKVSFRGIHFQFPIKVRGALQAPMGQFSRHYTWLQTDSIGGRNICGKWFFEWDSDWKEQEPITEAFKEKLTYGVAFELREDSCKTDQEIVKEIQKIYPGSFSYFEKYDTKYYKWERNCLTIFVKRTHLYPEGYSVPEVSFCYGLNSSQMAIYGDYTGYINNYPD